MSTHIKVTRVGILTQSYYILNRGDYMDAHQIHQQNMKDEFCKFALVQIMQNDPNAYKKFREILKPKPVGGDRDLFQFPIREGA